MDIKVNSVSNSDSLLRSNDPSSNSHYIDLDSKKKKDVPALNNLSNLLAGAVATTDETKQEEQIATDLASVDTELTEIDKAFEDAKSMKPEEIMEIIKQLLNKLKIVNQKLQAIGEAMNELSKASKERAKAVKQSHNQFQTFYQLKQQVDAQREQMELYSEPSQSSPVFG